MYDLFLPMDKFWCSWYWTFTMIVFFSITSARDEISRTSVLNEVQLSDTEVLYLNECLQSKEYMCPEDALNTIIELEHFYTLVKNKYGGKWEPSVMVDKVWHHHILNTQMYSTFSRQHFGMEILHHIPFWSGNRQNLAKTSGAEEEYDVIQQYNTMVSMFGLKNVNKTVWFISEDELDRLLSKPTSHIEL
jgi:hypothetical protein